MWLCIYSINWWDQCSYSAANWTVFYLILFLKKNRDLWVKITNHTMDPETCKITTETWGSISMTWHTRLISKLLGHSNPQIAKCLATDIFWNGWHYQGPSWSWWKDRECQHWSIQRSDHQLLVRDNIVSNGWAKKMCNLPGKIRMSQIFKCAKGQKESNGCDVVTVTI